MALHLITSIWDCFLWIDRSVSVTIGVHLPCIDGLLQETLGRELLLQNYNNVTVMPKRRVVNTDIMSMYMQTLLKQLKMIAFWTKGEGGHNSGHNIVILNSL